jgi:fibronectin-binding autotransporter adhesin
MLESRQLLTAAVWTGAGSDSLFTDAANWQGNAVPTAGQDITFPSGAARSTVTFNSNETLGNIEFDASYTLTATNSSVVITLGANVLATAGNVAIDDSMLLTQQTTFTTYQNAAVTLNAPISDGGQNIGLIVAGDGPLTMASGPETYTGTTSVMGGSLISTTDLSSTVDLYTGSSFEGNGSVNLLEGHDGTFSAANGASAGTIEIANGLEPDLNTGGTFVFDIGGPGASSEFVVNGGPITLGNSNLTGTVINGYVPQSGDVITLIHNLTGTAVSGTFDNLPQGATTTIGGQTYTISYTGGSTGQDVTLTYVASGSSSGEPTIVSATSTASTHGYTIAASVVGADSSSATTARLTYTWTAVHLPSGAKTPTFSANGTHAAGNVTARFYKDGGYILQCTVKDAAGNSISTDVAVAVSQKVTALKIEPHGAHIAKRGREQIVATVLDQFAHPMRTPQVLTYFVKTGSGSVSSSGLFTAGTRTGAVTIEVEVDNLTGTAGELIV